MGHCLMMRKGKVHTAPVTGVLASSLAVGSTVKLMEGGAAVEYLVVHQGIPENSSLYDSSCNGTWLLRKDIHSNREWNTPSSNIYENSTINTWLNGDFFNSFGTAEQASIRQAIIPYLSGGGEGTIQSGANGLSVRIFLLSVYELGLSSTSDARAPEDGAKLSYFESGTGTSANNKRVAYLNGAAAIWWTRTQCTNKTGRTYNAFFIRSDGSTGYLNATRSFGIRPALVLPSNALFDETTKLLKGVK